MSTNRSKSPRAPSLALDEAINKALKLYDLARTGGISPDDAATQLGYKNSNNGAYISTQASIGYYGLLIKKSADLVGVPEELQLYKFNPDELEKRNYLISWLKRPKVFADLLEKFPHSLPSDKTLIFNLISMGFSEQAAEKVLKVFKQSIEFCNFYTELPTDSQTNTELTPTAPINADDSLDPTNPSASASPDPMSVAPSTLHQDTENHTQENQLPRGSRGIRTPVRLAGNRLAWVETPIPFYQKDRDRLIAQIKFMLCDDDQE